MRPRGPSKEKHDPPAGRVCLTVTRCNGHVVFFRRTVQAREEFRASTYVLVSGDLTGPRAGPGKPRARRAVARRQTELSGVSATIPDGRPGGPVGLPKLHNREGPRHLMSTPELLRPDLGGVRAHRHGRLLRRERPAHDDRARAPRRRVQQGRGHLRPLRRRGARGHGRHLYRRRARQHPQPRDGPAGRARRHARHPPRRDGARRRDPRRAAPLARLRRLRAPGGRPAAAAARGLLRARRRRRAGRLAGRGDPRAAPARAGHLRRARRLPAPGPHPLPRDLGRRVRRRRRPRPVPGGRRAVAAAEALLLPRVLPGPDGGLPRRAAGAGAGVAVRGVAVELVDGHPGSRACG